jgi:hypothetical protein
VSAFVSHRFQSSIQIKKTAAISPAAKTEPVSNKSRNPDTPDVGADVLLELGGGSDALEEAAGSLVKAVLLGVEPLPPIFVLLIVAVEAGSDPVVSKDNEDVARSIDSLLFDAIAAPVAAVEAFETAELTFEATELASDEAPDMIDDALFKAAEVSEAAIETTFDSSVDAKIEIADVDIFVKGTTGIGTSDECEPMLEETTDAIVVASDVTEPATLDATMLSCLAAELAALEILEAETETSDMTDAVVGTTRWTGATVTGSVGADTVTGSWIDVLKPFITTGAKGAGLPEPADT